MLASLDSRFSYSFRLDRRNAVGTVSYMVRQIVTRTLIVPPDLVTMLALGMMRILFRPHPDHSGDKQRKHYEHALRTHRSVLTIDAEQQNNTVCEVFYSVAAALHNSFADLAPPLPSPDPRGTKLFTVSLL